MKALSWNKRIPRTRLYVSNAELVASLGRLVLSGPGAGVPVAELEKAFAEKWQAAAAVAGPYARTCFYFLLKSFNLPENSEIITTPINIHDIFNMILCAGFRPKFIDIDPASYQMSPDVLEQAITPATRAVFVTHLFGIVPDMERIAAICKKHNLLLIEDASHSFGATLRGKQMGTFGKAAIFSFSSLKSISTGYGGMVISDDSRLIANIQQSLNGLRACTVRDMQGILRKNIFIGLVTQRLLFGYGAFPAIRFLNRLDPKIVSRLQTDNPDQKLLHEVPPEWLWRFSPLQADLAMRCLKRLDAENAIRQKHARIVLDALGPHAPDRLPALLADAENVFWRFPFKVPEGHEFAKFMNRYGIDVTTTLLPCCSQMEIFRGYAAPTPHASAAVRETFFLPIEHSLTEKQVSALAEAAVEFVRAGS